MDEEQNNQPPMQHQTVLCIEDEKFIGDLYKRALEKAGFSVTIAAEGEEGYQEASSGKYDIILLDIMLPNVNGVDMLHKLRGEEISHIKSKIIITTNLDQKEEVREELEKLADGYLIKAEITPKELVAYVKQLA